MVEGMSVRSIERITRVHRDTILRLLLLAAEKINAKLRHEFENLVTCGPHRADAQQRGSQSSRAVHCDEKAIGR
jgi:hypothetical protein